MNGGAYQCALCGRSVSAGAVCACLTPGITERAHAPAPPANERAVKALERIASALETIAARPTRGVF